MEPQASVTHSEVRAKYFRGLQDHSHPHPHSTIQGRCAQVALLTTEGRSDTVMYFSPATATAIVRVARQHYRLLWASLTLITSISALGKGQASEKCECVVRVVRVSGTVVKAQQEAIRRARAFMRRVSAVDHVDVDQMFGSEDTAMKLDGEDDEEGNDSDDSDDSERSVGSAMED